MWRWLFLIFGFLLVTLEGKRDIYLELVEVKENLNKLKSDKSLVRTIKLRFSSGKQNNVDGQYFINNLNSKVKKTHVIKIKPEDKKKRIFKLKTDDTKVHTDKPKVIQYNSNESNISDPKYDIETLTTDDDNDQVNKFNVVEENPNNNKLVTYENTVPEIKSILNGHKQEIDKSKSDDETQRFDKLKTNEKNVDAPHFKSLLSKYNIDNSSSNDEALYFDNVNKSKVYNTSLEPSSGPTNSDSKGGALQVNKLDSIKVKYIDKLGSDDERINIDKQDKKENQEKASTSEDKKNYVNKLKSNDTEVYKLKYILHNDKQKTDKLNLNDKTEDIDKKIRKLKLEINDEKQDLKKFSDNKFESDESNHYFVKPNSKKNNKYKIKLEDGGYYFNKLNQNDEKNYINKLSLVHGHRNKPKSKDGLYILKLISDDMNITKFGQSKNHAYKSIADDGKLDAYILQPDDGEVHKIQFKLSNGVQNINKLKPNYEKQRSNDIISKLNTFEEGSDDGEDEIDKLNSEKGLINRLASDYEEYKLYFVNLINKLNYGQGKHQDMKQKFSTKKYPTDKLNSDHEKPNIGKFKEDDSKKHQLKIKLANGKLSTDGGKHRIVKLILDNKKTITPAVKFDNGKYNIDKLNSNNQKIDINQLSLGDGLLNRLRSEEYKYIEKLISDEINKIKYDPVKQQVKRLKLQEEKNNANKFSSDNAKLHIDKLVSHDNEAPNSKLNLVDEVKYNDQIIVGALKKLKSDEKKYPIYILNSNDQNTKFNQLSSSDEKHYAKKLSSIDKKYHVNTFNSNDKHKIFDKFSSNDGKRQIKKLNLDQKQYQIDNGKIYDDNGKYSHTDKLSTNNRNYETDKLSLDDENMDKSGIEDEKYYSEKLSSIVKKYYINNSDSDKEKKIHEVSSEDGINYTSYLFPDDAKLHIVKLSPNDATLHINNSSTDDEKHSDRFVSEKSNYLKFQLKDENDHVRKLIPNDGKEQINSLETELEKYQVIQLSADNGTKYAANLPLDDVNAGTDDAKYYIDNLSTDDVTSYKDKFNIDDINYYINKLSPTTEKYNIDKLITIDKSYIDNLSSNNGEYQSNKLSADYDNNYPYKPNQDDGKFYINKLSTGDGKYYYIVKLSTDNGKDKIKIASSDDKKYNYHKLITGNTKSNSNKLSIDDGKYFNDKWSAGKLLSTRPAFLRLLINYATSKSNKLRQGNDKYQSEPVIIV